MHALVLSGLILAATLAVRGGIMFSCNVDPDVIFKEVFMGGGRSQCFPLRYRSHSTPRYVDELVEANNDIALTILKEARDLTEINGNVLIAPHIIMTALGLLSMGANGDTKQEIRDAMRLQIKDKEIALGLSQLAVNSGDTTADGNETANYTLSSANGIWVEQSMELCEKYQKLLILAIGPSTVVDQVDFSELQRQLINEWVASHTDDNIRDLLPAGSITPLTRLVLASAVHFQGYWETKFSSQKTRSRPFQICDTSGSSAVLVDMMYQEGAFMIGSDSEVQIIELPYSGRHVSMVVLLPKDTSCSALINLENNLSSDRISNLMSSMTEREADLYLPRFDLKYNAPLKDILMKMGIQKAFNEEADLSGFDCKTNSLLQVSDTFHKVAVRVDEEGTTASAAVVPIVIENSSRSYSTYEFNVNRQFLFVIRDNQTKAVLFIGRVVNPNK